MVDKAELRLMVMNSILLAPSGRCKLIRIFTELKKLFKMAAHESFVRGKLMQRRSVIRTFGLAGAFSASATPAFATTQTSTRWRLVTNFPRSRKTVIGAAESFATKVNQMTDGRFQVLFSLSDDASAMTNIVEALKSDEPIAALVAPHALAFQDPTFALGGAIPFGLNSRQMTAWMHRGNGMALMRTFYAEHNLVNFPVGNTGTQMGGWYRRQIDSLADIAGLQIQLGAIGGKVMKRLGASPVELPAEQVVDALLSGALDAAESIGLQGDITSGVSTAAPNLYYPGWWEGSLQYDLFVNKKQFDRMTADHKAIVEAAASYAHTVTQAEFDAQNPRALRRIVTSGIKLCRYPSDVMHAAFQESMRLYEELSDTNANWKRIYADYAVFREDQNLWFRFAEASFDDFMQSTG